MFFNLSSVLLDTCRFAEAVDLAVDVAAQSRQRGDREALVGAILNPIEALGALGRWQEAIDRLDEAAELESSPHARAEELTAVAILCEQGKRERAEALVASHATDRDSEQADVRAGFAACEARLLRMQGRTEEARAAAERGLVASTQLSLQNYTMRACLFEAIECALELDDVEGAEQLLGRIEALKPGQRYVVLDGNGLRFRALLDAAAGRDDTVEASFAAAEKLFAEHGLVFALARTRLQHAEWLVRTGEEDRARPLAEEALAAFEELGAAPWVERARALPVAVRPVSVSSPA
jgi:tetratricopeptide (TPR) repeat protein